MPGMLGEIVTRLIDEQEDMLTVFASLPEAGLMARLDATRPDVLLMSCNESEAATKAHSILTHLPTVSVITLTSNGHEATLFELRPHEKPVSTVSPESLIATIREIRKC